MTKSDKLKPSVFNAHQFVSPLTVSDAGIDIQDDMGRHEVGMKENTNKVPQFEDNGCRLESYFTINKVCATGSCYTPNGSASGHFYKTLLGIMSQ